MMKRKELRIALQTEIQPARTVYLLQGDQYHVFDEGGKRDPAAPDMVVPVNYLFPYHAFTLGMQHKSFCVAVITKGVLHLTDYPAKPAEILVKTEKHTPITTEELKAKYGKKPLVENVVQTIVADMMQPDADVLGGGPLADVVVAPGTVTLENLKDSLLGNAAVDLESKASEITVTGYQMPAAQTGPLQAVPVVIPVATASAICATPGTILPPAFAGDVYHQNMMSCIPHLPRTQDRCFCTADLHDAMKKLGTGLPAPRLLGLLKAAGFVFKCKVTLPGETKVKSWWSEPTVNASMPGADTLL